MNKVIAEAAEVCASNAQMEWISAFRSKAAAHGGHAIAAGTNFFGADTAAHGCDSNRNFRDAELPVDSAWPRRSKDMRQGGGMRRHVAPARLLC